MHRRRAPIATLALLAALATGCASGGGSPAQLRSATDTTTNAGAGATTGAAPAPAGGSSGYTKFLLVVDENHSASEIFGSPNAPYLNRLANQYGVATDMTPGYPVPCPSLPAYLLLTSGSTHGVCDDGPPARHPIAGPSVFSQVAGAGKQWRVYAEAMPGTCDHSDSGVYFVRHTAAPYYTSLASECRRWDVPLGTTRSGALAADARAGRLPTFALVVPAACNDMHQCDQQMSDPQLIRRGDGWLAQHLPAVLTGPDFTAGRLVVVITWDEGGPNNRIPTLVLSRTTRGVRSGTPYTHCSVLRTAEDIAGVAALGCARSATSLASGFHLR